MLKEEEPGARVTATPAEAVASPTKVAVTQHLSKVGRAGVVVITSFSQESK